MVRRRTEDEQTASGAVILWGHARPGLDRVAVRYPCCGRMLSRSTSYAPILRLDKPAMCQSCAASGPLSHLWRGDAVGAAAHRRRARYCHPQLGLCQDCGDRPASERHHVDGDVTNDDPANIALLCRRCHMRQDGRLAALIAANKSRRRVLSPKPCALCGKPYKPLRRGLCGKCYDRLRGHPGRWKVRQHRSRRSWVCINCGHQQVRGKELEYAITMAHNSDEFFDLCDRLGQGHGHA